ncbi:hypothetical protein D3C77_521820 [compost metagenome]
MTIMVRSECGIPAASSSAGRLIAPMKRLTARLTSAVAISVVGTRPARSTSTRQPVVRPAAASAHQASASRSRVTSKMVPT